MIKLKRLALVFIALILLAACTPTSPDRVFSIVSGSENQTLESIVQAWGKQNRVSVSMVYKGSVEIASILQTGGVGYDAVWPANSLWINLGDTGKITRNSLSIMRSPVILGVKKSIAQQLGWVGNTNVTVQDLLAAMQAGKIRLMMTNPSQSNSGASAYFAFLYAFSGSPDMISSADLNKSDVQSQVKNLLALVNRTSESSGFLSDTFVANYDKYDAMMNYESLIIEANQTLVSQGKEPLYAVYLTNGLAIADSPLAYVDHGNNIKKDQFDSLQKYLLSDAVQQQLLDKGRRTGIVGLNVSNANSAIFNPDWGIDVSRTLSPIKYPNSDVIMQALNLYQDVLRKPSLTVFCLDFSGSMGESGEKELKAAMRLLLVQSEAKLNLLQATSGDLTIILPFSGHVWPEMQVSGADGLDQLYQDVNALRPGGGTSIYSSLISALDAITRNGIGGRNPAIILMTDGRSNTGSNYQDFLAAYKQFTDQTGVFVPVYAITFGSADSRQLEQITSATAGTIYDGTKNLVTAFKKAKGNN